MSGWTPFLAGLGLDVREPADEAAIAAAERVLGSTWPDELRELLLATDGVFDEYGTAVVHPVAGIVRTTRSMWQLDAEHLYMAFRPHLFIGDEGNGDGYLMRVLGEDPGGETDVYAWSHEDDSRAHYAYGMRSYVVTRVEEARRASDAGFDNATLDAFLDTLAFLALSDDAVVGPEAAVRQLEAVAAALRAAPEDQRRSFAGRAQGLAAEERDPARAEFFGNVSRDLGLFGEAP